jgi:uncharacterized peroxidase-related enzyme
MSFIQFVDEDRAQGDLAAVYDRIRRVRGGVADVMKLQSLNPPVLAAHFELYRALMFGPSELDRRTREMIGVLVSHANRCSYGVSHHGESLRLLGVPLELVEQLSKGAIPDEAMGEPLRELLRHAVGLTVGQATESGAIEHLRELGWSDAAILDATMVSAYFNMLNRLTTGLGITLESTYAQTCGPDQGSSGPTAVEPFAG